MSAGTARIGAGTPATSADGEELLLSDKEVFYLVFRHQPQIMQAVS